MLLGLWYLLQQPRWNKTASDSGSQCLIRIAMDITRQGKRVKAWSGGCFIFTGVISGIFVLGGTWREWYFRIILNVILHRPWNAFEKIENPFLTEKQNNTYHKWQQVKSFSSITWAKATTKKHIYIHINPCKPARIQYQQNMPLWHHERGSAETTMGGLELKCFIK